MLGHGITGGTQPREKIIIWRVLRVGGERKPSLKKLPITGFGSRIPLESNRCPDGCVFPQMTTFVDDHPGTREP